MALETVDVFTEDLDMTDFASRLVHSFVRTIDSTPELIPTTMDTMCSMMLQLGQKFLLFVPMVSKTVARHKISHQKFEVILAKITKVGSKAYFIFLSVECFQKLPHFFMVSYFCLSEHFFCRLIIISIFCHTLKVK